MKTQLIVWTEEGIVKAQQVNFQLVFADFDGYGSPLVLFNDEQSLDISAHILTKVGLYHLQEVELINGILQTTTSLKTVREDSIEGICPTEFTTLEWISDESLLVNI